MSSNSFLGTGWGFPVAFDKLNGRTVMVSDLEDVMQSMNIILNTTPGERVMQPEFGCNLKQFVFARIDAALITKMDHVIYHALLNFEPRVKYHGIDVRAVEERNGYIEINIDFSIITTNTRHNVVFPYYLNEGTNL